MIDQLEKMKKARVRNDLMVESAVPDSSFECLRNSGSTSNSDTFEIVAVLIIHRDGGSISLTADRSLLEDVFPEIREAVKNGFSITIDQEIIRIPLKNDYNMNPVHVITRLLNSNFTFGANNGGFVSSISFWEYLFVRKVTKVQVD